MTMSLRVTGAWTQILSDWLDKEKLKALDMRAQLAVYKPNDVVPLAQWADLLLQAKALRPDDLTTGLQIGAMVQPQHVGVLAYLALCSLTLADALNIYQRYEKLFYGVQLVDLAFSASDVALVWPQHSNLLNLKQSQVIEETGIAAFVTFMRSQIANPPHPKQVCLVATPSPDYQKVCEVFYQCPVVLGCPQTSVHVPLSYLTLAMPHSDPGLTVLLEQQAQALVKALPSAHPFDQAVQLCLVRFLPDGEVSIHKVAQAMHQSPRTLQRRLAERGMTWHALRDSTREHLAKQYLAAPSLALIEVALLLGYSEQSAFSRAFRRWTGETPHEYRAKALG